MSKKILAWNINPATNRNISTPEFVGEEIKHQESEFIVLTEFCKTKNHEDFIQKYLIENEYDYILSNNLPKHNDILIAWKKDKYDITNKKENILTNRTTPNFAYVVLKDKYGLEFVLAGVRITIESYENRAKQFRLVLDSLKSFSRVVIGGDFNCLRRGTPETNWNISLLSKMSKQDGFKLVTPNGQSIYAERAINTDYEFAEDHFVIKGIEITNERYDRSFTDRYCDIYLHGRDFSIYDFGLKRNIWSVNVGSGIPDHAILLATINW